MLKSAELPQLYSPLTAWYVAHARKLSWRETRDRYAYGCRIMLEQTCAAAAIPALSGLSATVSHFARAGGRTRSERVGGVDWPGDYRRALAETTSPLVEARAHLKQQMLSRRTKSTGRS